MEQQACTLRARHRKTDCSAKVADYSCLTAAAAAGELANEVLARMHLCIYLTRAGKIMGNMRHRPYAHSWRHTNTFWRRDSA